MNIEKYKGTKWQRIKRYFEINFYNPKTGEAVKSLGLNITGL